METEEVDNGTISNELNNKLNKYENHTKRKLSPEQESTNKNIKCRDEKIESFNRWNVLNNEAENSNDNESQIPPSNLVEEINLLQYKKNSIIPEIPVHPEPTNVQHYTITNVSNSQSGSKGPHHE